MGDSPHRRLSLDDGGSYVETLMHALVWRGGRGNPTSLNQKRTVLDEQTTMRGNKITAHGMVLAKIVDLDISILKGFEELHF
jgi:hypothetical protein